MKKSAVVGLLGGEDRRERIIGNTNVSSKIIRNALHNSLFLSYHEITLAFLLKPSSIESKSKASIFFSYYSTKTIIIFIFIFITIIIIIIVTSSTSSTSTSSCTSSLFAQTTINLFTSITFASTPSQ